MNFNFQLMCNNMMMDMSMAMFMMDRVKNSQVLPQIPDKGNLHVIA